MQRLLRTWFLSTAGFFSVYLVLRAGCSAVLKHAAADAALQAVASVGLDALDAFVWPVMCLVDMSTADSVVATLMGIYFAAPGLVVVLARYVSRGVAVHLTFG